VRRRHELVERVEVDDKTVLRGRALLDDARAGGARGGGKLGERGFGDDHGCARSDQRARQRPEQIGRAVADDDPIGGGVERRREGTPQARCRRIGVTIDRRRTDCFDDRGARTVGAHARAEVDDFVRVDAEERELVGSDAAVDPKRRGILELRHVRLVLR
jgi:hypothetical protein